MYSQRSIGLSTQKNEKKENISETNKRKMWGWNPIITTNMSLTYGKFSQFNLNVIDKPIEKKK